MLWTAAQAGAEWLLGYTSQQQFLLTGLRWLQVFDTEGIRTAMHVRFVAMVCMCPCLTGHLDYQNRSVHNSHKLLTRTSCQLVYLVKGTRWPHGYWRVACRYSMCNWITQPHIWGLVRDQTLLQGPPRANLA